MRLNNDELGIEKGYLISRVWWNLRLGQLAFGLVWSFILIERGGCCSCFDLDGVHLLFGGFKISSEVCDASPFCFKTLEALDFFFCLLG